MKSFQQLSKIDKMHINKKAINLWNARYEKGHYILQSITIELYIARNEIFQIRKYDSIKNLDSTRKFQKSGNRKL